MEQTQNQTQGPAIDTAAVLWSEQAQQAPQTINVYSYAADTMTFNGSAVAVRDPLDPSRYLIPANATTEAPPEAGAGEEVARVGDKWVKRAKLAPVVDAAPSMSAAYLRRAAINARLDAIDKASARSLRESLLAQAGGKALPAFAVTKLTTLETEAAALRAELAGIK